VTYVNKTVGTKVTSNEYEKITQLVEAGIYLSNSDFAREAIRDKLRSIEIIKIPEDVDYETAKKEVLGYYEKYQQAYEDEVADDLELDLKLVMQITEELAKEGRLGEV
jgi:Arc/MetJ-type ribon-helix-helix transcriptional regulator